ncbi:SDR family oxidoreductase [Futiania mangrovi]|uniref:SDR family NAD(P)-dependent oxidoreductase n=1 Tax=Futiania mangrovi TaxID=2959716 RepID=A0A9J6PNX0_9PROT|nr:SDR family NAD(P)-dependent oxidoreductase [Futiania mangrovii]MCP1337786.1 SDR family NAD(P)-dependent oxidoreductase [Futiania mangrovii]
MKTILITGASSGIGRATAKRFQAEGWTVIATMRDPSTAAELDGLENVLVTRLDVTDAGSISDAVAGGISRFGKIDVLLNNAGYGAYGALEAFSTERIRRQFDTNVIGLLEVTKAVLPHMRANRSGTIVNISSIGGQITFPLGTLYHGTKFAVEGLSEALHYELEPLGIRVRIVEPGMIKTDFGGRSFDFAMDESLSDYAPTAEAMGRLFGKLASDPSAPEVVAGVIWDAANETGDRLRFRAGPDADRLLGDRKAQDDGTIAAIIKHFEGGQGTATGLSALIAEELNMSLQDIRFEMAPADNARYANLFFGSQGTGGSTAMANSFMQYGTAAAAAREMLIGAAAEAWGVRPSNPILRDGIISGAGHSAGIGDFVAAAATRDVPAEPRLKDPSEWRVIGVDQKGRLDTPAKIDGSAQFSMDVQLDNQMVVAIRRAPRLGGTVATFDDSAARIIPGFIMAIEMPNNRGVMVYAETTWAAFQARDALEVSWDFSAAESRSSDALKAELFEMVRTTPEYQASETDLANAILAIGQPIPAALPMVRSGIRFSG